MPGWGHPDPDRHSDPAQIQIQIQTQTHIQIQLLVGCGDVSQLAPALALPSETQHQHCVWTCVRHSRATKMFMRVLGRTCRLGKMFMRARVELLGCVAWIICQKLASRFDEADIFLRGSEDVVLSSFSEPLGGPS